ncbi:hypothetical protein DDQ50_16440 [Amnibacterium flavum]|uniref:DUF8175 domain-containing protein n=1 Tax=Amnibacterium flavum TaxID=2173173 RepID=A0A2V1HSJ0_9MICO|nr:hypothetical protein DDQ50_16440 [Amnibacterium flavum]
MPGPGRDAALLAETVRGDRGISGQIAGVQVLSYTEDEAVVDTAFQLRTGELVGFAIALRWVEGDWKVLLTDKGQPPYRPVLLQSLGGYVPWSGL